MRKKKKVDACVTRLKGCISIAFGLRRSTELEKSLPLILEQGLLFILSFVPLLMLFSASGPSSYPLWVFLELDYTSSLIITQ